MKSSVSRAHDQSLPDVFDPECMVMLSTKRNWHREAVFPKNDIKNKKMD